MPGQRIDGKAVAAEVLDEVAARSLALAEGGTTAHLAVVRVGDDPASISYIRAKRRAAGEVGIESSEHILPSSATDADIRATLSSLNEDPTVHAILLQLPLPDGRDGRAFVQLIRPEKDADGLHPFNLGRLVAGDATLVPCTPAGVVRLLGHQGVNLTGARVVVLGRSMLVGRPLALMLSARGADATVTVCHSRTRDLADRLKEADVLIAAAGSPGLVTPDMIRQGAVVIDVGINRVSDPEARKGYRLVGDVQPQAAAERSAAYTPVPGGVGPMTVAMLMRNTVVAAEAAVTDRQR